MTLSNADMRAIEIMLEQMERLIPQLQRNRQKPRDEMESPETIVRRFYDETTRLGQFELNYLRAAGRCLAPDTKPEDQIVTTLIV